MSEIKALRKKATFTQESLAKELGVDRSTIAKWETGTSFPRAEMLPKLAKLFDCSIDDLFEPEQTDTAKTAS
jgi:transcriptional regulator with XRE-family HTH domain